MLVVDASWVVEILSGSAKGLDIQTTLSEQPLHAPHLIDLEVSQAIRKWEMTGAIRTDQAKGMFQVFYEMRIERHAHYPLLPDIWALRHNLTAYDASYLALAMFLRARLLTFDDGLRKAAARHLH